MISTDVELFIDGGVSKKFYFYHKTFKRQRNDTVPDRLVCFSKIVCRPVQKKRNRLGDTIFSPADIRVGVALSDSLLV